MALFVNAILKKDEIHSRVNGNDVVIVHSGIRVLFDFPMKEGAQLNCFGHAYNQDNLWKEVKGEQTPVVRTNGVTAKKLLMLSVVLKNYEVDWALVVGFGFLVTELLRSKGVKLKEGVATHRNAYLLQTKLHEPKGKGVTLKKKVVVEESSSNMPLTDVVKTANAKCKLDVEGKSQSKTVPKVPMVSLQSKANGLAKPELVADQILPV
nr:uncharacterized protein LOC109167327 [Ipomoea batatas]